MTCDVWLAAVLVFYVRDRRLLKVVASWNKFIQTFLYLYKLVKTQACCKLQIFVLGYSSSVRDFDHLWCISNDTDTCFGVPV
jgi:hypothetical protein